MPYFFVATIVSFVIWKIVRIAMARCSSGDGADDRAASLSGRAGVLLICLSVVLVLILIVLPDYAATKPVARMLFHWFETATGFRVLAGLIGGFLIATLHEQQRRAERLGGGDDERHSSGGGKNDGSDGRSRESSNDAPWWARSAGLIPLALLVLFILVVIAPRGELSLDFVRSVKTPFVEATFSRNDAQLNFDIESEPQGFFKLDRTGLHQAIHMARTEAFYLELVHGPWESDEAATAELPDGAGRMANALDFMLKVLQPAALCIEQVDDIYRDPAVLSNAVNVWGAALARAALLASLLKKDDRYQDDLSDDKKKIFEAIRPTLKAAQAGVAERRERQRAVIKVTSGKSQEYTTDLCRRALLHPALPDDGSSPIPGPDPMPKPGPEGNPAVALERLSYNDLASVLREPAAIHASSLFFLWAGSPGGAKRILERAEKSGSDVYPGVAYLLGFTKRWLREDEHNPLKYLEIWNNAIAAIDRRIERLGATAPEAIQACEKHAGFSPVIASVYPLRSDLPENAARIALANRPKRADHPCGGGGVLGEACKAGLVLGYLTHFREKVRNHIVFEAARELLTGRMLSREDEILELGLVHADRLENFVEADGYRTRTCFAQQSIRVAAARPNAEPVAITTLKPERDYALYLDSAGLIRLANGIRHDEDATIERALGLFRRSLATGSGLLRPDIRTTIVEHREQARGALGLAD